MIEAYFDTVVATFVMLVTVVVQHMVATIANGRQKNMIPGVVNKKLGHESFVFRSHRTFQNSIDNIPFMLGFIVLAVWLSVSPILLAIVTWVYAICRIIHMVFYYGNGDSETGLNNFNFSSLTFIFNLFFLFPIPPLEGFAETIIKIADEKHYNTENDKCNDAIECFVDVDEAYTHTRHCKPADGDQAEWANPADKAGNNRYDRNNTPANGNIFLPMTGHIIK